MKVDDKVKLHCIDMDEMALAAGLHPSMSFDRFVLLFADSQEAERFGLLVRTELGLSLEKLYVNGLFDEHLGLKTLSIQAHLLERLGEVANVVELSSVANAITSMKGPASGVMEGDTTGPEWKR